MTEGERWARDVLAELRSARFGPRAWVRFLVSSYARARERRRERRRAFREALAFGALGLGAWSGVAASGHPVLAAAGAAWWLAVLVMLDWHLGMLERPDGRPIEGLGAANVLCLARAGVVPALAVLPPRALAAVFIASGILDGLDGPLARARDEVTRLGLWLDGATDTIVLGTTAVVLARAGLLPIWVAALVLARYGLPWVVVPALYFGCARAPGFEGYVSGRAPGLVLFAGLGLAALDLPGGAIVAATGAVGGIVTLGATGVRLAHLRSGAPSTAR